MSQSTNPEAVVLGALFDFAGHLRTSNIINPLSGIDGFAKKRKLQADEIPTLTWREQLDTLRDPAQSLPTDSELVTDLLLLAEAFKDGDPGADNKVFDVLNDAATRLRRLDAEPAPTIDAINWSLAPAATHYAPKREPGDFWCACFLQLVDGKPVKAWVLTDGVITREIFNPSYTDDLLARLIARPLKGGAQ
jgi:hypothetical protein